MKINKTVLLIAIGLMSFSAIAVPMSFLKNNYKADPDEKGGWLQSKHPKLLYKICLDKSISAQQSIVVMCANGDGEELPNGITINSGYYDIWYLDGDKPIAHTQQNGDPVTDSGIQTAAIGKNNWAVVLEDSYSEQGYAKTSNTYYMRSGKDIVDIASLTVAMDNSGVCDSEDKEQTCLVDDIKNHVQFSESDGDFFVMKVFSKGQLGGKPVDKTYTLTFDSNNVAYPIPEELNLGW